MLFSFLSKALVVVSSLSVAVGAVPRGEAMAEVHGKRVAIIGAGAAGSSAAYHLSQYASLSSIPTNITVFERSNYVGGRTTTVDAWSSPANPIELGGSIFVTVNQILVDAARQFNLSTSELEPPKPEGAPELGVWNGKEFVVVTSNEDGWWGKARLLWRYGIAPIRTNNLMKATVAKFLKMYEEPLFPWKSLSEAVEEVGLTSVTSHTAEQYLKVNKIEGKFANEIIQASTRVNYASNLGLIHGLEAMVCMATNGAMAVRGGNWQIFSSMLKSSPTISTHLNTSVTDITHNPDTKTYTLTTSSGQTSDYDTVILAAPYQFSSLTISPLPKHIPDEIPYVSLHVTLFASPHPLTPSAFNLPPGSQVPQFVLTTLPPGEDHGADPNGVGTPGFFSISIVSSGMNPHSSPPGRVEYIYKIFSAEPVTSARLSELLGHEVGDEEDINGPVSWIHRKLWHSYPYEFPRVTFEEIELQEGLWYTSGIESFISTMETSALMGKNVARLVVDSWVEGGDGLKVQGWEFEGVTGEQKPIRAKL
ncbi:prenylcysteine oxidase 1 [Dendryphion nanum]|uniref:Prenylcysteine oxidase 1 n=1 Tax=Dendryphion nanum TaxID=256645 RepID=A0A9P9EIM0_9PLEO|nr:prenylcysteine oxidase 1 [Dendryphion nanum]